MNAKILLNKIHKEKLLKAKINNNFRAVAYRLLCSLKKEKKTTTAISSIYI